MSDLRAKVRRALVAAVEGGYIDFALSDTDTVALDIITCDADVEGEAFELVRPIVAEWQAEVEKLKTDMAELAAWIERQPC